jgi:hypothetical protein
MHNTNLEEALRLFKPTKPAPTICEYEREQQRIRANYERLKAERLARERSETIGDESGLPPTPDISLQRNN